MIMNRSERIAELRRQVAFQIWGPYIIAWVIVSLLVYAAACLGLMKMFEKAGEKAWKAWIPFYNLYILFKICWSTYWFWPVLGVCIFTAIFGNLRVGSTLAIIFAVIILIMLVGLVVVKVFLSLKVAKSYGKSIPWAIGLIFLDFVFYNLLGWGSAKYDKSVHTTSPEFDFSNITRSTKKTPKTQTRTTATSKPKADNKPKVSASPKPKAQPTPKGAGQKKIPDYIDPKPKAKF